MSWIIRSNSKAITVFWHSCIHGLQLMVLFWILKLDRLIQNFCTFDTGCHKIIQLSVWWDTFLLKRTNVIPVSRWSMRHELLLTSSMVCKQIGAFPSNKLWSIRAFTQRLAILNIIVIVDTSPDIFHCTDQTALVLLIFPLSIHFWLKMASGYISAFLSTVRVGITFVSFIELWNVLTLIFLVKAKTKFVPYLMRAGGGPSSIRLHRSRHRNTRIRHNPTEFAITRWAS